MAAVTQGWNVVGEEPDTTASGQWTPVAQHPIAGPSGDTGRDADRFFGTAAANALAGLLSFPHLPAQAADWVASKIPYVNADLGADKWVSSLRDPSDPSRPLVPDFQTAREMAFQTTGGTEYQPQNLAERRALDATTAGMLAVTDPTAIPAALAGGAAGGQAAETFPDHPIIASTLAAIPAGMATNMAVNTAQRIGSAALNRSPSDPYGAFRRQNLPTDLSGTVTGNPGLLWAEKFASRMPGSEGAMADARTALLNAWQDRLGTIADTMGSAKTPTEVGQVLQSDARNWLTNFKANTKQLWDDFRQRVPPATATPVSNYQQTLNDLLGEFPGAAATGKAVQPATLRSLSDALGVDLQGGNTLPWQSVQNLRTAIGEKLTTPGALADTSQAALKRIYGALTKDMENGAGSVSPEALTAFHRANAVTAAGHDLLENHLNPVLTAANPEDALRYAMEQARRGGTRLGALTFNLPNAAGELGSYALRNAATDIESPTAFSNAMTGRRPIYSPEAQDVLFPGSDLRADIADMAATGGAMKPVEADLAHSPTATHETRGVGRVMTALEMARTGGEHAGMLGRIGGFALGLVAPNLMGRAAQFAAMNPLFSMSRLYGQNLPIDFVSPNMRNRLLIGGAIGQDQQRAPFEILP